MNETTDLGTVESPATFDRIADTYDDVALSAVGRVFRDRVRAHVRPLVGPGVRVLDVGCGTGLDAVWMAQQGCRVVAVDASGAMVERARAAIAAAEQKNNVHVSTADIAEVDFRRMLALLPSNEQSAAAESETEADRFDVVVANFGVINCVPDLAALGDRLWAVLDQNASLVLVSMSSTSLTESIEAVLTRNRSLWSRRRSIDLRAESDVDGYRGLDVRYHSAADVEQALASHFRLEVAEAIGVVLPTFEQRRLVEARPRLLSALRWADATLGPLAAKTSIGDHHIVRLAPIGSETNWSERHDG